MGGYSVVGIGEREWSTHTPWNSIAEASANGPEESVPGYAGGVGSGKARQGNPWLGTGHNAVDTCTIYVFIRPRRMVHVQMIITQMESRHIKASTTPLTAPSRSPLSD